MSFLKYYIASFFLIIVPFFLLAQKVNDCGISNATFSDGEEVTYVISYTWLFLWTDVGEVNFTVNTDKKKGKNLLHLKSVGNTYAFYDWFFKVRDLYESWIDPVTMQPIYFNRAIYEGGFTKENEYTFDWTKNEVLTRIKRKDGPNQFDSLKIEKCSYDVVSAIYSARNFDYSNIQIGKMFPVTTIFDKEIFHIGFKYLGKEKKNIKDLGKINCMKFQVDLVVGDVFSGDQKLFVWVTDDMNHLPVFIESPIKVGSIKARVVYWKGLKSKVTVE